MLLLCLSSILRYTDNFSKGLTYIFVCHTFETLSFWGLNPNQCRKPKKPTPQLLKMFLLIFTLFWKAWQYSDYYLTRHLSLLVMQIKLKRSPRYFQNKHIDFQFKLSRISVSFHNNFKGVFQREKTNQPTKTKRY